jgi:hypothetical protein
MESVSLPLPRRPVRRAARFLTSCQELDVCIRYSFFIPQLDEGYTVSFP